MQAVNTTKTDYKTSMIQKPRMMKKRMQKWKWPFAIILFLFSVSWRADLWWPTTPKEIEPLANAEHSTTKPLAFNNTTQPELSYEVTLPALESLVSSVEPSLSPKDDELLTLNPLPQIHTEVAPSTSDIVSAVMSTKTKSYTIQSGDTLAHLFQKENLSSKQLHSILTEIKHAKHLNRLIPGQVLNFEFNDDNRLERLTLKLDKINSLLVQQDSQQKFYSEMIDRPVKKKMAYSGGIIQGSLYLAGKQARLSDKLIMELAQIFEYDIDFALDIHPGDTFKVLFEEKYVDNEKIGNGPILAAEFVSRGQKHQAFRYTDENGHHGYFKADGQSVKKAFIRTPVEYTRISSHFNLNRRHPVLHKIRAHKGVDYAAPTGTPVKASGNGKVIFVGKKGGYGNTVILQHGPKYSTLYAHLSRFAKSLPVGATVKQGQVIGYVGSTGLASGPHLHYEFRINGVHHNPLTVALPNAKGVAPHKMNVYLQQKNEYLALMDTHEKVLVAAKDVTNSNTETQ